jgi:hypothetical protein
MDLAGDRAGGEQIDSRGNQDCRLLEKQQPLQRFRPAPRAQAYSAHPKGNRRFSLAVIAQKRAWLAAANSLPLRASTPAFPELLGVGDKCVKL